MMTPQVYETAGMQLRAWRKERGMSCGELGALVGTRDSYIAHCERGTRLPSLRLAHKLLDMANIPMRRWVDDALKREEPAEVVPAKKGKRNGTR